MATTIAHPRSVRSGPSGKTIAGFLVGVLAAFAVGYGIDAAVDTVDASPSSALGADQAHIQRAADFAAQQSMSRGADQVILQKAADYAALQARVAESERMIAANDPKGSGLAEQWTTQQSQLEPKTPGPVE